MIKFILFVVLTALSQYGAARPYITTKFKLDDLKHTQLQVTNKEKLSLNCYVAINGYKIHFTLQPKAKSIWYRATDRRFNYTHFSTYCRNN